MIIKIQNSRFTKGVAVILLVSFLMELTRPSALFALTGGPSQPEMAGFTPVNTNEMVNLFNGDFHYTVPIMTVPGPNGGYPINLNYNSGIGMEHDASWVGLGWNLNPGAINRQVRGIPDDFNGILDNITKTYKRRNNTTFVFSPGTGLEVAGANFGLGLNMSSSLVYNTYAGISLSSNFGVAASYIRERSIKSDGTLESFGNKVATVGGSVTFDSDNGVTPSFSMNGSGKHMSYGVKFGYNSKSGVYSFGTNFSISDSKKTGSRMIRGESRSGSAGGGFGVGSSFSTAAELPPVPVAMTRNSFGISAQVGGHVSIVQGYVCAAANVAVEKTPSDPVSSPAYGFMYAENAIQNSIQDFNREKEIAVNQHSLNLPLPVMTPDIYTITGETMGGTFRAYRPGIGYISDRKISTTDNTFNAGADASFGYGFQVGVSLSDNVSKSVSGPWSSDYSQSLLKYKSKNEYANLSNKTIHPVLYEPFYFKMSGEQTGANPAYLDYIGGERPVAYTLEEWFSLPFGIPQTEYALNNELKDNAGKLTAVSRTVEAERNRRTQSVEYQTVQDMGISATNGRQAHHIAGISVVNENGERYTYGKALYNSVEKEVAFSVPQQALPASLRRSVIPRGAYSVGNANGTTRVGKEKLYSCTETNPYAYSYLITSVTSPDYVDITGDGPSDDDLGYWVKFDYKDVYSNYKWRFPYEGASLMLGNPSNRNDDIGSYNYGTKEIKYVNAIETKTHIALFYTSPRKDGYEVSNEYEGGRGSRSLYKLDSIRLFCKSDMDNPIKTAVFTYSYLLCQGNPGNSNSQGGKLTLDSVYFKYGNSDKESRYAFTYNTKYAYDPVKMDRWGNYKGDAGYFEHYVSQDKNLADGWSEAWCLTKIELPSGGTIQIDYESDDYAYVQNKQAMKMTKLGSQTTFDKEGGAYYVYFEKDPEYEARDYVSNFKNNLMLFRFAVAVERGSTLYDYVQGYVKIKPQTAINANPAGTVGKVEVEPFEAYDKVHPIYFLCCQNLRKNRPDVLFDMDDADNNTTDALAFFKALVSKGMMAKSASVFDNKKFYNFCLKEKYFDRIITGNPDMPSYLRLNVPDKIKYGGGHRVKRIRIWDNWEKSERASYTQEYYYRTVENGKVISSGVAEYEPQVCAEETSLRYPVYDEVQGFFFKEDEIYSEEPYGESYFPGANVGYSRVVVKTVVPAQVNLAASGIQMHEFYTAKDFPITVSQTVLKKYQNILPNLIKILTGGFKQVSASAFSQGYQIVLNDMHGKLKRMATYPYLNMEDENEFQIELNKAGAVTEVSYHYKTKNGQLDNHVQVLTGDNRVVPQILGQTYDFTTDLRETYSHSQGFGLSGNFGMPTIPLPSFYITAFPSYDSFEETVRSVATTKVIYKTGILEKTVANNNGSVITTHNLQWDPYTGEPLLSTTTNDFEQPVYSYSMPAYWSYPNLGAASDNYRAFYRSGWAYDTLTNAFDRYDRVSMAGAKKTAESILRQNTSSLRIKGWNVNGALDPAYEAPAFVEVLRSRNANQLTAVAASTVSLSNPLSERYFPLFDAFNNETGQKLCFEYADCNGQIHCARIVYYAGRLHFFKLADCSGKACFDEYGLCNQEAINENIFAACSENIVSSPSLSLPDGNVFRYRFKKVGNMVIIYNRNNGQPVTAFTWKDPRNLFRECLDDVLQASAVEFSPDWKYDYADAGLPTLVSGSGRESYLGIPNLYRSLRSNLFVVDRKQEGGAEDYLTNAAHDGLFDYFSFFNPATGNADNLQDPWTWTAEITRYNPFNFEIENKNALGIYSSALYGYRNSLATAVASNARYYEIGFDSFENDLPFTLSKARGHLKYLNGTLSDNYAHSGIYSLRVNASGLSISVKSLAPSSAYPAVSDRLTLIKGKKYVFSCWLRGNMGTTGNSGEECTFTVNGVAVPVKKEEKIEEWQRIEVEFTVPAPGAEFTLKLSTQNGGDFYIDDVRILPFNSSMKTYVYNPSNARLLAELDENNYAVFYNYDEEGSLVQVKKETERGIRTIQTTRQHLKNNN